MWVGTNVQASKSPDQKADFTLFNAPGDQGDFKRSTDFYLFIYYIFAEKSENTAWFDIPAAVSPSLQIERVCTLLQLQQHHKQENKAPEGLLENLLY